MVSKVKQPLINFGTGNLQAAGVRLAQKAETAPGAGDLLPTPGNGLERVPLNSHADVLFGSSALLKSRGRTYEVTDKTDPVLRHWQEEIEKVARREGLDPFPTRYYVMDRDTLISTTARTGFPVRYNHWSFGQAYQDMLLPQKHGHSNLYELVINTDPTYAYLLNENPLYAQKLVMAHVAGHSDFFRHNMTFRETNRGMLNRVGDNAMNIRHILDHNENVTFEEMEKFIDRVLSVQWLIDLSEPKPRPIKYEPHHLRKSVEVASDYGKIDDEGYPAHIRERLNSSERLTKERQEELERMETKANKIPHEPEPDVLAFLIENSPALKPWQRDVLAMLRDESYYFAPQIKTKIMNEGWATFWHHKLMTEMPELVDHEHATDVAAMHSRVIAGQKFNLNPYQLGFYMFKNLKEAWDKGRHGDEYEKITDYETRKNWDTKENKGLEKIFEVRTLENDYSFLNKYFTKDVAEEMAMYTWDPSVPDYWNKRQQVKLTSRDYKEIKQRMLNMLENGGQPLIRVVDGNFENRGELRLEHVHSYDLEWGEAEDTVTNLRDLWGRPVHLDTYQEIDFLKEVPPYFVQIMNDPNWQASLPPESIEKLEKILKQRLRIKIRLTGDKDGGSGPSKPTYHALDENGKVIGDRARIERMRKEKLAEINRELEKWQREYLWK